MQPYRTKFDDALQRRWCPDCSFKPRPRPRPGPRPSLSSSHFKFNPNCPVSCSDDSDVKKCSAKACGGMCQNGDCVPSSCAKGGQSCGSSDDCCSGLSCDPSGYICQ